MLWLGLRTRQTFRDCVVDGGGVMFLECSLRPGTRSWVWLQTGILCRGDGVVCRVVLSILG